MTSRRIGEWHDDQPIYRQLRDHMVALILDRTLEEGDPLPSARTVAAEYRINPLTVLRAYQELSDDRVVETRRGLGMFILPGARARLLDDERKKFMSEQWPRIMVTIRRLGLSPRQLLGPASKISRSSSTAKKEA
jgi:GntR family transcriptional regulator